MTKLRLFLILFAIVTLFTSCMWEEDEFAPYQNIRYDIEEEIEGNIFVISEIEEQTKDIAKNYSKDLILYATKYKFFHKTEGEAILEYAHSDMSTGHTTVVEVHIDISTKKATHVIYEHGVTKRLGYRGEKEIADKNCNAQQLYLDECEKSDVCSDAEYATVEFYSWGVDVHFFDENNGWLK